MLLKPLWKRLNRIYNKVKLTNRRYPVIKKNFIIFMAALVFGSHLQAADLFHTESAWFAKGGKVIFNTGLFRFNRSGLYGSKMDEIYYLPLEINFSMINNVQLNLNWPFYVSKDIITEEIEFTYSTLTMGLAFGFTDNEFDYKWAINFYNTLAVRENADSSFANDETINVFQDQTVRGNSYPMAKDRHYYALGYRFTKSIKENTTINVNFDYVYELASNETIRSNIFSKFSGLVQDEKGNFSNVEGFTLFGMEDIFRTLFWRDKDLSDPWKERRNDHIEFSASVDHFFTTDYYIKDKKIPLSVKPFLEFFWSYRFSRMSVFRSEIILTPGVWIAYSRHFRFMFGLDKTVWIDGYTPNRFKLMMIFQFAI